MYILRVETGPGSGQDFYLTGTSVIIGRQLGNEVLLTDRKLSRRHVRLDFEGIEVIAVDLGSANGTRVNGIRITGPQPLYVGDVIRVGESSLRLLAAPDDQPVGVVSIPPTPTGVPADVTQPVVVPHRRARERSPLMLVGFLAALLLFICIGIGAIALARRGDSEATSTITPTTAPSTPTSNVGDGSTFVGTRRESRVIILTLSDIAPAESIIAARRMRQKAVSADAKQRASPCVCRVAAAQVSPILNGRSERSA